MLVNTQITYCGQRPQGSLKAEQLESRDLDPIPPTPSTQITASFNSYCHAILVGLEEQLSVYMLDVSLRHFV